MSFDMWGMRYWSLEYTAVYPKSPKWGSFKHNIDHHNWQTRGIPQPTYACIVHYTFVPTCTCHIPLSPKTPFFTRILPGIPGMPGYAHHIAAQKEAHSVVMVAGDIEEGNVVVIHVPCKHNGRVITDWVLYMCLHPYGDDYGIQDVE